MRDSLSGILIVDKEKNMTSHDVVDKVRRKFKIKKVGHAGTLDPNATGVLVLLLGKATKMSGELSSSDKEYEGVMKLGVTTTSGDCDGEVVNIAKVNSTAEDILEAIKSFKGESEQLPPMFSAKKVNGKRLYKLARKGIMVEREAKKISIKKIEVENIDLPLVTFRVVCSKGTYIRQLAHDIGGKLGCGAYLAELIRTRSGDFTIDKAINFSRLMEMDHEALDESIIRI